jgi:hypothetical protein
MPQPNDLSRSLVALDQNSTIIAVVELSQSSWLVAGRWRSLYPKAADFLFTEGTLQQLSDDNAAYALALINGTDLSLWHSRPAWRARVAASGEAPPPFSMPSNELLFAWR